MSPSSPRKRLMKAALLLIAAATALAVGSSRASAQEQQRWQLFVTPPDDARTVWSLQARHVASELQLDRDARRKLTEIYISARNQHLEKVKALPKTQESIRQFWQLREEASSSLEKSLLEALGEEKGKKAAAALGTFNFLSDNMAADILATQRKALTSLFKYQESVNKVIKEAREAGSFEGVREKFAPLARELAGSLSAIFSQEQMNAWKEKYRWIFGQPQNP